VQGLDEVCRYVEVGRGREYIGTEIVYFDRETTKHHLCVDTTLNIIQVVDIVCKL